MTRKVALWSATALALLSCLWAGEGGLVVSAAAQTPPAGEAVPAPETGVAPEAAAPEGAAPEAGPPAEAPPASAPAAGGAPETGAAEGAPAPPHQAEGEESPLDEPKRLADIMDLPAPRDWANLVNPVPADAASIRRGQELYLGKGMCHLCHGKDGDGVTQARNQFKPVPNDFFDEQWHDRLTDGQIMEVLQMGKLGTAMVPFVPDYLTEAEAWDVINFLRSLKGKSTPALEALKEFLKKQEEEQQRLIQESGG